MTRIFTPARAIPAHLWTVRACAIAVSLLFATLFVCPRASADVGVILQEVLDHGASRFTGAGHSAVYLSNICAEGPVKLRLCREGEEGSVITTYADFGENQNYEWNVVPLNIYMYGVADAEQRPLFASTKIKSLLEDEYRKNFLAADCSGPCEANLKATWRSTVAATFNRSIYIFVVKTTPAQDLELIQKMNAAPNQNKFSAIRRNCANFTKQIVNDYFPRSTHSNFLNDFGMTSPKAVAQSFARFARSRLELEYRVLHFAQLPGTYKRSDKNRLGTEQIFRAKSWLVPLLPLAVISVHETLPVFISSYLLTGRFNPEHEWERHASPEATELRFRLAEAKVQKDKSRIAELTAATTFQKAAVVGNSEKWSARRTEFANFLASAAVDAPSARKSSSKKLFKELDREGTPLLDGNGSLWMEISGDTGTQRVGIAANNVLTPDSNRDLAYQIMVARLHHVLSSPARSREMIPELEVDWSLLHQAHQRISLMTSSVQSAPRR